MSVPVAPARGPLPGMLARCSTFLLRPISSGPSWVPDLPTPSAAWAAVAGTTRASAATVPSTAWRVLIRQAPVVVPSAAPPLQCRSPNGPSTLPRRGSAPQDRLVPFPVKTSGYGATVRTLLRPALAVALPLALALVLTGCSGEADAPSTTATSPTAPVLRPGSPGEPNTSLSGSA